MYQENDTFQCEYPKKYHIKVVFVCSSKNDCNVLFYFWIERDDSTNCTREKVHHKLRTIRDDMHICPTSLSSTLSILSMIYKWNRVAIQRNAFWDCDI